MIQMLIGCFQVNSETIGQGDTFAHLAANDEGGGSCLGCLASCCSRECGILPNSV